MEHHPDYPGLAAIQVAKPGGVLSLLQEDGGGPILLTLMTSPTESPKTWHGTGNPFPLRELWSAPVRLPRATKSGHLRTLPLLYDLCRAVGSAPREWGPRAEGALGSQELIQNRWIDAQPQAIIDWLELYLDGNDIVALDSLVSRPAFRDDPRYGRGPAIYLTASDELGDWVKLGKAETGESPVTRLFKQQCCNPRRLRHLRVWRPLRALEHPSRWIEAQLGCVLKEIAVSIRSEWYRVAINDALTRLDACASENGFGIAFASLPPAAGTHA